MPPEFIEPYDGYLEESRAGIVIGVVTFLTGLTFVIVAARIYTRVCMLHQMGPDDWAAISSFLLVFGCSFAVAWNVRYGLGAHTASLSLEEITLYLRTFFISIVLYNAALVAIKATFLLQYYRVLAVQRIWKQIFAVMLFLIVGWSIAQVFVQIFICSPITKFWDVLGVVEGKCIPNIPQWYINAGGNIVTDIAVLVLPLPALLALKLKTPQKIVLLGVFCLGFFTVAVSIVRIKFLKLGDDDTWDNVESACWSISELCAGVICACLPTLRPLAARYLPSFGSRARSSSTSKGGYYVQTNDERTAGGSTITGRAVNNGNQMELGQAGYSNASRRDTDMDLFGPPSTEKKGLHHTECTELSEDDSVNGDGLGRHSSGADDDVAILATRPDQNEVGITTDIGVARPDRATTIPEGRGIRIDRDLTQVTSERI